MSDLDRGRPRRSRDRAEGRRREAIFGGLDGTLSALADPTRRGVVDLLRKKPRRAGELAESLGVSPQALSRHLRVLRASGLVDETSPDDDARVKVYRLEKQPFDALRKWVDQVEALWTEELDAFKKYAESKRRDR
jgi:DNA-binding transcriptional ArsR family regulator